MWKCECECHHWDATGLVTEDAPCCDRMNERNIRPWGRYDVLYDGSDCKVKRITINPGHKLSYQYHDKRDEFWKIISGEGFATFNDRKTPVAPNYEFRVRKTIRHRIENTGSEDLVFIEIQTGSYFGEDDIVRLEDDYGRT